MQELLIAALKSFVIPEILTAYRAHKNATGREPTTEEILAALDLDAKRIEDVGQAYLDATRPLMGKSVTVTVPAGSVSGEMPPATNG